MAAWAALRRRSKDIPSLILLFQERRAVLYLAGLTSSIWQAVIAAPRRSWQPLGSREANPSAHDTPSGSYREQS
jgi:hypothetical protein